MITLETLNEYAQFSWMVVELINKANEEIKVEYLDRTIDILEYSQMKDLQNCLSEAMFFFGVCELKQGFDREITINYEINNQEGERFSSSCLFYIENRNDETKDILTFAITRDGEVMASTSRILK